MNRQNIYLPGIPDEDFMRAQGVPMTKNEIRVLSLAKLRLSPEAVIYDVGAGTGSISIESKLLFPDSQVYSVERDSQALHLLKLNSERFGVELNIIAGAAPEALVGLPEADRIFIGGSGGNLAAIIAACNEKLKVGGWIVINSISINTASLAFSLLTDRNYRLEAIQVNIALSSSQGSSTIWQARNPVTIISGQKED